MAASTIEEAEQPSDNDQIADDDHVIRKVEAVPHLQARPGGGRRISPAAFSASSSKIDPEEGMSCNSISGLKTAGVNPNNFSPTTPVLAVLSVAYLKSLGLKVVHRPIVGDPSHCNVLGVKGSHRKKLLNSADLMRCPSDVTRG